MVVTRTSQDGAPRRLPGVRIVPFDTVVSDHGAAVLRVCRAMLGPDEAADAWSETFLSALRSYSDLSEDANVRAWLLTIARRRSIDQIRARGRAPVPTGDALPDPPSPGDPADVIRDEHLLASVRRLPPRQRAAVAYRYLADLSYDDVAELLESTPAAARRAAADGIAALRSTHAGISTPTEGPTGLKDGAP